MEQQTNKTLKVVKIALTSVFYVIIALLLIFSIATLTRKTEKDIPNIFGLGFLAVHEEADSMVGPNKDSFNPGDLVFVKVLNKKQQDKLDLAAMKEQGVVISFYDFNIKTINTHRIVEYDALTDTIRTKGDNKEIDNFFLDREEIRGIYSGKLKGVGKAVAFMQTPLGFAIVVIVPMLLLLGWQGYKLIKNIYAVKEETLKESLKQAREEERERIKRELLEEMNKKEE